MAEAAQKWRMESLNSCSSSPDRGFDNGKELDEVMKVKVIAGRKQRSDELSANVSQIFLLRH